MPHLKSAKISQSGFSLVESLITILILGIGALGLSQTAIMMSRATASQSRIDEINQTERIITGLFADPAMCLANLKTLTLNRTLNVIQKGPEAIKSLNADGTLGGVIFDRNNIQVSLGVKITDFNIKLGPKLRTTATTEEYLASFITGFAADDGLLLGSGFLTRRTSLIIGFNSSDGSIISCSTELSGTGGTPAPTYIKGGLYGHCSEGANGGGDGVVAYPAKSLGGCACDTGFTLALLSGNGRTSDWFWSRIYTCIKD